MASTTRLIASVGFLPCAVLVGMAAGQQPARTSPWAAGVPVLNLPHALLVDNTVPRAAATTLQIHDPASFQARTPLMVTRLRFRPARTVTGAFAANVSLAMGHAPHQALFADATFANNMIATSTVLVHPRATVQFPAVTDRSWAIPLPFAQPFAWSGNAPLAWLARVTLVSSSTPAYELETWQPLGTPRMEWSYWGCPANTFLPTGSYFEGPGGELRLFTFFNAPASGGFAALQFAGKTQVDLAPFGAPGCWLFASQLFLPAQAQSGNIWDTTIRLPLDPGLANKSFLVQFALLAPATNALGIVTSPATVHTFGPLLGAAMVQDLGSAVATRGVVNPVRAVVIGLN